MILQLSDDERDLLIGLLDTSIAEARQEIYRTEKHAFKEAIRTKKFLMEILLQHLVQSEDLKASRNVEFTS